MKFPKKIMSIVLLFICLLGLLPVMTLPANAASSPVLVLTSTSAINPLMTFTLDPGTFRYGGPFTVTYEWKSELQPLSGAQDAHGFSGVTGTIYGSSQQQTGSAPSIYGYTDWTPVSYSFQNVGYFNLQSGQQGGNVLRIGLWQSSGTLYVRNLIIRNASGNIVYNFNSAMSNQVNQMVAGGQTYAPLPTFYATYDYSVWISQKFGDGYYSAGLRLMEDSSATVHTTTPTTAPTTPPTQGTQDPCANGHRYQNGFCIYCAKADPYYNPCAKGHAFENGFCIRCGVQDPHFDPCANGHEFENGYCIRCLATEPGITPPVTDPCAQNHSFANGFCVRCAKTDLSFDPCEGGHTFLGAGCISCGAEAPAPASRLLPILLVIGAGLSVCAILLILIFRKKKSP